MRDGEMAPLYASTDFTNAATLSSAWYDGSDRRLLDLVNAAASLSVAHRTLIDLTIQRFPGQQLDLGPDLQPFTPAALAVDRETLTTAVISNKDGVVSAVIADGQFLGRKTLRLVHTASGWKVDTHLFFGLGDHPSDAGLQRITRGYRDRAAVAVDIAAGIRAGRYATLKAAMADFEPQDFAAAREQLPPDLPPRKGPPTRPSFSPDDVLRISISRKRVVGFWMDGTIAVWDLASGKLIARFTTAALGREQLIDTVCADSSDCLVACRTAYGQRAAIVYDARTAAPVANVGDAQNGKQLARAGVSQLMGFSADGNHLFFSLDNWAVAVVDSHTGKMIWRGPRHTAEFFRDQPLAIFMADDGTSIATLERTRLYGEDLAGKTLWQINLAPPLQNVPAVNGTGMIPVRSPVGDELAIWDGANQALLRVNIHNGSTSSAVWHQQPYVEAASVIDGTAVIREKDKISLVRPDGTKIAMPDLPVTTEFYFSADGKELYVLPMMVDVNVYGWADDIPPEGTMAPRRASNTLTIIDSSTGSVIRQIAMSRK